MLCAKCKNENLDYARFCQDCGAEIAPVSNLLQKITNYDSQNSVAGTKKNIPLVMIVTASALVVITLALFFIVTMKDDKEQSIVDIEETGKPTDQTADVLSETLYAEFVSFYASRMTTYTIEGDQVTETIGSIVLTEFELTDGSIVGMATIELDDGTLAAAIIEGHLLDVEDFNARAVVIPIDTIEVEGEMVEWKVIELVE